MEPNLSKGDLIFVNRYYYKFNELKKDDVVLIKPSKEVFSKGILCHRIIATSNDNVAIRDKKIYVNNREIQYSVVNSAGDTQLVVPDEMFFQKGDNITTKTYGLVANDQIIGKVIFNFTKMKLF
jgi:signal peptidase I